MSGADERLADGCAVGRAHTFNFDLTPRLLEEQADAVAATLAELDTRGTLSSLEFADQSHFTDRSAWYGPKRIKHILRALWDRGLIVAHHRQGGRHYYFDYVWEVYKPEARRRWGYYVLPVFYGDRFVTRLDGRFERGVWTITRWWWEPEVKPRPDLLDALHVAAEDFAHYLRCAPAARVEVGVGLLRSSRR